MGTDVWPGEVLYGDHQLMLPDLMNKTINEYIKYIEDNYDNDNDYI
jgi:hypothetical protein